MKPLDLCREYVALLALYEDEIARARFRESFPLEGYDPPKVHPERADHTDLAPGGVARLAHLAWMLQEMRKAAVDWSPQKASRWLGFVQGVMWTERLRTLEELRHDNRDLPADHRTRP